jgi:hypothetical protein
LRWRAVKVIVMNEDLPAIQRGRRAAARERLAARRQRVRAIRRRVAGMSLATFLAASGAVLVQLVSGHDPALAHATHAAKTVSASRSADSTSTSGSGERSTSRSSSQSSSAAATSPSAVTTSAS